MTQTTNTRQDVFEVSDLRCNRGAREVLRNVSLIAHAGEIVGIIGANGAGKTTLFDTLCGLRPAAGGVLPADFPADRIAYLTQVITVPDALRLGELAELVFSLSLLGTCQTQIAATLSVRARDKFNTLWARRANSCSYGEKRWFVLVVVLALDADVLILDEPTAGVDIEYRHYIWDALRHLRARGKIILFSTHLMSEVAETCDHFYFLKDGCTRRFTSAAAFLAVNQASDLDEAFVRYLAA